MTSMLEELAVEESAATELALSDYRGIVARLAAGDNDPTLADVQATLKSASKTTTDLAADVCVRRHRNSLRSVIAFSHLAEQERPDIEQQIQAADDELKRAQNMHEQLTSPLHTRLQEIGDLHSQAANAKGVLHRECKDESLLNAASRLRWKTRDAEQKTKEQRELVKRIQDSLAREKSQRSRSGGCQRVDTLDDVDRGGDPHKVAEIQSRLATAESELAAMVEQRNELILRSDELVVQMIEA